VSTPLVANMVEGGKSPLLPAGELQDLGFRVALFANTALRSAVFAVQQAMASLDRTGSTADLAERLLGWDERQRFSVCRKCRRPRTGISPGHSSWAELRPTSVHSECLMRQRFLRRRPHRER
jgi:hypothetical protein